MLAHQSTLTYRKLGYFGSFLSKCGCLILVCLIFGAFQKMIVLFWCFSNGQKKINARDQCFFYIVDQKLEVKYHR